MNRHPLNLIGLTALAGLTWACGPGVSGSCPNPSAGNAAELAQAQGEGTASEAEEAQAPPKVAAAPTKPPAEAATAAADGGVEAAQPGEAAKPGEPTAVAAAAAGGGEYNITGTVESGGKPTKFAVVFLEDAPLDAKRGMKITIDQRMMTFIPYTSVIAVGGAATFVNSDPFPHNVFSPSNEKFDIGTMPKGGAGRHVFKAPGAYTLLCNVHPGMIGYVYVAPSSFFATANVKGQFTIKKVPEGTYKIDAWAPKMAGQPKSVTVKGGDATVDLELQKK